MLYHLYFVMIQGRCRCRAIENAAGTVHGSIPEAVTQVVLPNTNHAYVDHHPEDKRDFSSSHVVLRHGSSIIEKEALALMHDGEEDAKLIAKKVRHEQEKAHNRVQARLREKAAKKKNKNVGQNTIVIEMVEGKSALAVAANMSGGGKGEDDTDSDSDTGSGAGSEDEDSEDMVSNSDSD